MDNHLFKHLAKLSEEIWIHYIPECLAVRTAASENESTNLFLKGKDNQL